MTTTGSTTSCSSKRLSAPGSASRTLVSRTYVRAFPEDGSVWEDALLDEAEVGTVTPRRPARALLARS